MCNHPDPAAAIALARQYSRLSPEYPDQLLSLAELQRALGRDARIETLPGQFTDPARHRARLHRVDELALKLLGVAEGPASAPFMVDRSIYLTAARPVAGPHQVSVDYGHDMLALLHYAAHQPHLINYPVSAHPTLAASDLMRRPYWDGEVITEVSLDELELDGPVTTELAAEIHIRWI